MVDVVVIGRGYWGAAAAWFARYRDLSTLVIDDNDPRSGSRAASGICDPSVYSSSVFSRYWPEDWAKSELDGSLDWLVDRGGVPTSEWFWNRFRGTAPREGANCIYLPSTETIARLAGPGPRGSVVGGDIENGRVTLELRDGRKVVGRSLVVAAGSRTDDVLTTLGLPIVGVSSLYGRGTVYRSFVRGETTVPVPVSVMVLPYVKHTVRRWGSPCPAYDYYKVGDTGEDMPGDEKKIARLRDVAKSVLPPGAEEVGVTQGFRPVTEMFLVEKVAPRVVVATGGNRVGLGLAGLAGKRVVEILQ